jgi:septum site-determining protein MinC
VSLALAANPRPRLRLAGRSFLAFVLEPHPPVSDWLADLDAIARQSFGFFANRPVVLDLSALAPDKAETEAILDALKARAVRVIAVEGIDPAFVGPVLAPLALGKDSAKIIDFPGTGDARSRNEPAVEAKASAGSLLIDKPVRSGQSIFHPEGDLVILGAVSSGAEVIAGGSVHIYGALRGRAIAGATGNAEACIFCRKFEAELVAIDGCYQTVAESPAQLAGKPVRIRLRGDAIVTEIFD